MMYRCIMDEVDHPVNGPACECDMWKKIQCHNQLLIIGSKDGKKQRSMGTELTSSRGYISHSRVKIRSLDRWHISPAIMRLWSS